jgi:PTH1 family peptidyl-tRNA hydrolase
MYLVVGLGNPGRQYELTRHNIGYRVIDRILKDLNIDHPKSQCQADIHQGMIGSHKIILAKPQTFMNLSGDSVIELVKWFKIEKDHLIVISDDLDLEKGQLRVRPKGNSGGHKGLESIISRFGNSEFIRVRIGIGRPAGNLAQADTSDYVLENIPSNEIEVIDGAILSASEAVQTIINEGLEAAMNKFNPL